MAERQKVVLDLFSTKIFKVLQSIILVAVLAVVVTLSRLFFRDWMLDSFLQMSFAIAGYLLSGIITAMRIKGTKADKVFYGFVTIISLLLLTPFLVLAFIAVVFCCYDSGGF